MIKIIKSNEYNPPTTQGPSSTKIADSVRAIIADVVARGDTAVLEYTQQHDGCSPESFEVPASALDAALTQIGAEFAGVLQRAAGNIEAFHRRQVREGFVFTPSDGVVLGQRILPLHRVGIYIPGGTAPYPSTVLMNAIPAKIAGVGEIIMVTPPSKDGVNPAVLAAAKIAGVDRVFTVGGAQAIAALAYGTESIPRVDKITGPGNEFVAEAKRQVFGVVGIDMIAGPSDILIIADTNGDPVLIAADMLSQCEHGGDGAAAVLVTTCENLARSVAAEIERQLGEIPREAIARQAVENHSKIIIAETLDEAFDISNDLAPEHLEIFLDEPFEYLGRVTNAGSVFLGRNTPEPLGDYYAGPNHTLPTSGTARFSSGLGVEDFTKRSTFTYYSEDALRKIGDDVVKFAQKEGFDAHARAVSRRTER
ncbi:MAG: histidinol dehydrogenase [Oscillospiraceae bacterium]|nr:histidinol dehydrogenase [Oscillospiraceae bacterium]